MLNEHLFNKHETADQVMSTPSTRTTNFIAEYVTRDFVELELWKTHNVNIMMKVLECKAESCDDVSS